MIIGINGYIGSGKDTVGSIIQYLTFDWKYNYSREIPSFEQFLEHSYQGGYRVGYNMLIPSTWQIKKFAGKLKQIASLMTGIPVEKFEDQEFKNSYLGKEWSKFQGELTNTEIYLLPKYGTTEEEWKRYKEENTIPLTIRQFLQLLGTEAIRDGLHTNAWVNALFADYKEDTLTDKPNKLSDHPKLASLGIKQFVPIYPNWIITDVRFPNEAEAIKERGGVVIRVVRDETITGSFMIGKNGFKCISGHASETALDDWNFDHIIRNDRDIKQLIEKVKEVLNKINLNN